MATGASSSGAAAAQFSSAAAAQFSSAAAARASSVAAAQSSASDDEIVENVTYRRLPDGRLEAEISYDVPGELSALEFQFEHDDLEVAATDGFERSSTPDLEWDRDSDGPTFTWDGHTDDPRVVVRHDATRDTPATYAGGTDDWAVVLRPSTYTRWRYDGAEPEFGYEAAVDGEGVAGEQYLVLGPHEVHETTVDGERIRLVVPDAADTASSPERILASLADASERLDVGRESDVVTVVATPTEGVEWAHRGLSLGPDARVNDDVSVDRAMDLWVHEYVHTRQDRSATTPETEWLVEATAEYYAATAALERGQVDFSAYRGALAQGGTGPASEAVLAEPDSWRSQANYRKGALVVAAIDRELRAATDGDASFQDVLAAWNEAEEFDEAALAAELEALGGPAVREYAREHATTNATPSLWDEQRHRDVFDVGLASVSVDEPTVEVRPGAARDRASDEPSGSGAASVAGSEAASVAGSEATSGAGDASSLAGDDATDAPGRSADDSPGVGQVVATVAVENDGDAPGRYRVPLRVDGTTVAVETGAVAPDETQTVRLVHELQTPGQHAIRVGSDETRRVTVPSPESALFDGFGGLGGVASATVGPTLGEADALQRTVGTTGATAVAGVDQSPATAASTARDGRPSPHGRSDGRAGDGANDAGDADDDWSGARSTASERRPLGLGALVALFGILGVGGLLARP